MKNKGGKEYLNDTGKIIQDLRIKAGYTQKSLASALHITDKAISKWERGICLPDVSLLPKLSLLLDTDVELLVSSTIVQDQWVGLIDITDSDFSQIVYDKPLVYYLLSHYLLLGIKRIHVLTNEHNQRFLNSKAIQVFGIDFQFSRPDSVNMMVLDHPWFLFGSDLTQQYQGAMISRRLIKLVPRNQFPVFFFIPDKFCDCYFEDKKQILKKTMDRTLGRGMVCFDMGDYNKVLDVASFVRTYQKNSGLLIGSLEEIAYRCGMINDNQLSELVRNVPYGDLLRSKPQVG